MQTHSRAKSCLTAALLGVCVSSAFAQLDTGTDNGYDDSRVEYVEAVRHGRAPTLDVLLRRLDNNIASGVIQPIDDGAINDHQLPPYINTTSGTLTGNASRGPSLLERSQVIDILAPNVDISVEGVSSDDNVNLVGGRVTPPDTNGDVGLNHFVQYINLGWVVLNKSDGSVAAGPFAGNTFWQGFGGVCETLNAGDPIVLYDHLAGRWFFSQFTGTSVTDGHQCVAVSDGEDPLGPYTLYDFVVSPGAFNDYPHIGLWEDGYYMTTHEFTNPGLSFIGTNLTVFDRQQILAGNPNAGFVQFSSSTSGDDLEFGTMAGNLEGPDNPPPGTCNYLVHATDAQAFGVPGSDRLRFWEACINFSNPNASTLNQINSINIAEIDINLCGFSRDCIPQPGTTQRLDPNAANTQYRFNMRMFPGDGVLKGAVTRNVDVGGDRAGVFWAGVDINPTNNATSISDGGDTIGIIDFNDGLSRWMGSATLDQDGNIGIGYTRGSASSFPSIYFTVHERGVDGPGAVQTESVCVDGTGSTTTANRWADYASTSMDPVDGCTFWHTNEYVETTGARQWNTRVCTFSIPGCGGGGPGNQAPNASFTSNCTNLDCSFDASGSSDPDGSIVSYAWTFGDGNNGSGVNTSNSYATPGTFTVTLTVTDNEGATDSATQSVTVTTPPVSNCPAGSIDFNNFPMTSYSTQDNTGSGSVVVDASGDTLTLTGNRWRRSTQTFNVTPNTVVEFEFASSVIGEIHGIGFEENDNISDALRVFEFYGTQNWTGAIQFTPEYSGSGNFETIQIPIGQTYTGNNLFLAFVNDKDAAPDNNVGSFRCVRVFEDTPVNDPPTASFTSSCTDLSCSFDGSGSSDSDGTITNYSWTFGDGNTGSGVNTSNTYGAGGTFNVTLTVTDNDGATDSVTQSVTVTAPPPNNPPTASFTSNCTDLSCSFDGSGSSDSDGSIVSYAWTFGDGNNGSGVNTSNTYGAAGTFNVTLTVTDDDGATDSTTQSVTVTAPPTGSCPAGSIDFNSFATTSYSTQDNTGSGSVVVEDGGTTLTLTGNRWRRSTQTFNVTPNTVVEFEFASNSIGEIHGIGFEENDNISDALRVFEFYGTQNWGGAIQFTPEYSGSGNFETIRIPIGQTYTGNNMFLAFVNDKDAAPDNNVGSFRCVRVFEDTPPPQTCTVEEDFSGGIGAWANGAAASCSTGAFVAANPTQQSGGGVITQVGGDNTTGTGNALITATNTSIGNADVDGGTCILESPVWNVSAASTLNAAYFHGQRDANDDAGDFFELEMSTDGGNNFSSLVSIGDEQNAAAWTDVTAAVPAGSNVQLRIRVADGPAAGDIVEAGIDDVSICDN